MEEIKQLVKTLIKNRKTIATMESCTGGALASEIINVPGASNALKFSAITYSDEYKIKMGVKKEIIDIYGVYSEETAKSMASHIADFAASDYGVGITGIINKEAYVCIYKKQNDEYFNMCIVLEGLDRKKNKSIIVKHVVDKLNQII